MELQTISQVTKELGVTTRMLRYYEEIGLLKSMRMEGYAYRVYDEQARERLSQILILRKLRLSLKQIGELLADPNMAHATTILQQNISEIDSEIHSLSTIRTILQQFADILQQQSKTKPMLDLLSDETVLSLLAPVSPKKLIIKEEKNMEDLKKANDQLNKLTDKDVRIVYLPPATVATCQREGSTEPEDEVSRIITKFVLENDLIHVKPDIRRFGFNAPNPHDETNIHGYEMWVTIPDDMDVPESLVKKHFDGGLYAAHMIPFGAFEDWELLAKWVNESSEYEYVGDWNEANMFGWLEETLNYVNRVHLHDSEKPLLQLDLLIPIKKKE